MNTKDVEKQLKPCPFCGSKRIVVVTQYNGKVISIYCDDCPAEMTRGGETLPGMVKLWNTRN